MDEVDVYIKDNDEEPDEVGGRMEESDEEPDVVEARRGERDEVEQHREESNQDKNYEDEC